jgi:cold shock CspA family protein
MPSFTSKLALAGAVLASKAAAHGLVQGFATDGQYQEGYILNDYYTKQNTGEAPAKAGWYEEATDNGFVAPDAYGEPDIICHKNAENAAKTGSVAAGGKVDFCESTSTLLMSHDGRKPPFMRPHTNLAYDSQTGLSGPNPTLDPS